MNSPVQLKAEVDSVPFGFENTYGRLPPLFFGQVLPTPVAAPRLIQLNTDLAELLRLDPASLASPSGVEILAGNRVAEGSSPLAMAYAGHQFGHFVPQLGDGRAILLGELVGRDGLRYDVQLKGAGPTPYSRRGDGRAALGPVLREYLLSEAMAALGVPTTRALAAVATGENVFRETILPGAVFTRVARGHLRVGTFQFFAARGETDALRTLVRYATERLYPELAGANKPVRSFLDAVIGRQARLIAQWMGLGFIHGVMNTDNMSISGETIDYGPCAFMEAYHPETVFSSIDRVGRYAWGNQPDIALWNLTRLAEALLPLLAAEAGSDEAGLDAAKAALEGFGPQFAVAHSAGMAQKLGWASIGQDDVTLLEELLQRMQANEVDWTLFFRRLADAAADSVADAKVRALFRDPTAYDKWAPAWRSRLEREPGTPAQRATKMRAVNPAYIPRNHRVEEVIAAGLQGDFAPFTRLLEVTSHPFEERQGSEAFVEPARPEERVRATFCGT